MTAMITKSTMTRIDDSRGNIIYVCHPEEDDGIRYHFKVLDVMGIYLVLGVSQIMVYNDDCDCSRELKHQHFLVNNIDVIVGRSKTDLITTISLPFKLKYVMHCKSPDSSYEITEDEQTEFIVNDVKTWVKHVLTQ